MRVLLTADVHANWEALLALQRAEPQPDALLFVGDAVGYGPEPAQCALWLAANATLAVCGNHDQALTNGIQVGAPPELEDAAQETVALARKALSQSGLAAVRHWAAAETIVLGGARFYLTHRPAGEQANGHFSPATSPESVLESMFADTPADLIVLGHTHVPAIRQFGERLILNPGSLGQPRYGVPDATYAVWEDGRLQIRHLHYDHQAAANRLRLMPLSPEVSDQLADILESGLVA